MVKIFKLSCNYEIEHLDKDFFFKKKLQCFLCKIFGHIQKDRSLKGNQQAILRVLRLCVTCITSVLRMCVKEDCRLEGNQQAILQSTITFLIDRVLRVSQSVAILARSIVLLSRPTFWLDQPWFL